jgi:hypothetical protein
VGYYKLLFRGFRPARLGRLKKLTSVSVSYMTVNNRGGGFSYRNVAIAAIDTIDTCGRCSWNSHLDKLDAGDDTAKATDTV